MTGRMTGQMTGEKTALTGGMTEDREVLMAIAREDLQSRKRSQDLILDGLALAILKGRRSPPGMLIFFGLL